MAVFLAIHLLVLSGLGLAQSRPGVYLNQTEIDAIKAEVAANRQPWKSAFDKLKIEADGFLNQAPLSVTFQGSTGNDYYTMKPYDWSNNMPSPCGQTHCDGQVNPKADRGDYTAAITLGKAVRALGLGYAFTADPKYAQKAVELIRVWALASATYMRPRVFGTQAIEQFITFPGMFYGADLVWNYGGWSSTEKQQFAQWVQDFASHAATLGYLNNWEDWRQVFVASGGALIGNSTLLKNAFDSFRAVLSSHIGSDGRMLKELGRTLSLDYSIYALNALTQVAEIARHRGTDLYGYVSSGRSLELAWDFHVKYLLNPSSWPWEQIKPYNKDGVALYELANARKPKPSYLDVINFYGRPMYENRTMGPTTLTHAGGAQTAPAPGAPTNLRVVR